MTPLLVASISILYLFYRTYAWGPETGFFLRNYFVRTRRLGKKPGFFVGVRKSCFTYSGLVDTNGSNKLRSSMGSSSKTRLSPLVSL
jgi:hypothetical protein